MIQLWLTLFAKNRLRMRYISGGLFFSRIFDSWGVDFNLWGEKSENVAYSRQFAKIRLSIQSLSGDCQCDNEN